METFEVSHETIPELTNINKNGLFYKTGCFMDLVSGFMGSCAGYIMLINSFIITYEVIMRHFFRSPTIWVFDISGYLLVWFGFFSVSYGIKVGSHISIDIITSSLNAKSRLLLEIFSFIICIIFSLILFIYGFELCYEHYKSMELQPTALYFPTYIVELGMVVGTFVMFLQAIWEFLKRVTIYVRENLETPKGILGNQYLVLVIFLILLSASIWLYTTSPAPGLVAMLFVLLLAGVPVYVTLGIIGCMGLYILLGAEAGLSQTAIIAVSSLDNFVILAIPMYILAGQILMTGGIGRELFDVCFKWVGHFPGGLAATTIASCAVFAAISGSSVATAAAIGIISLPEMLKHSYDRPLAYGSLAAGGTLGIMIPPSAAMIIYSGITDESTGALFIGGIIPGIILTALFCIYAISFCSITGRYEKVPPFSWKERAVVFKSSFWALMAPVLVIGSIYTGIATPTEAGGLSVVYALIVSLLRKKIRFKQINEIMSLSTRSSTMILMIVIGALLLGAITTFLQIPQQFINWVISFNAPNWIVMALLCLMYIILGMFLEVISILLITMPIVYPLIIQMGYNGIWYGVFIVILMEMALITPPVGLNIYVIQGISKARMSEVIKGVYPYMLLLLIALLLLWIFPKLILFLPSTMGLGGLKL